MSDGVRDMNYCSECGQENKLKGKFCPNCGASLELEKLSGGTQEKQQSEPVVDEIKPVKGEQEVSQQTDDIHDEARSEVADQSVDQELDNVDKIIADWARNVENETPEPEVASQSEESTESSAANEAIIPSELSESAEVTEANESVESNEVTKSVESNESENLTNEQTPKRINLSKKQWMIGAIVAAVLVILFVGYQYGNSVYTAENKATDFIAAINEKDTKKMVQLMTTEDDHLKLTEENVQPLLKYFTESKKALAEMKRELKQNNRTYNLEIKQVGKKFLLFNEYKVEVYPVYPEVTTNQKGTIISVNDKKYTTTKKAKFKKEIGPFVPGIYKFSATANELTVANESREETVQLFNISDTEVDLTFAMMSIPIETNIPDAKILVDGKEQGQIKDGTGKIGPLVWHEGLTIQLTGEVAGKTIETEKYAVEEWEFEEDSEDNYPLYLDFDVVDRFDIEYIINDFYYEIEDASLSSNEYDKGALGEYFKDGVKNPAFSAVDGYITSARAKNKDQKFVDSPYVEVEVTNFKPLENNQYQVDFEAIYYDPNTDEELSSQKYSGVKVSAVEDDESINFEFIDLGDGGKTIE
ncbi:hypothetical protein BAU15_02280 [Enterococcus sp. JM4C]|uniref:TcaA 3rd/4th domain-containing protein n=1 Tax=Candidatus Enterococcus huntleyi TaxID=1857217 RepID=UPI001379892A|nr:hypothetical protein [Enterococcus sp. JM4C]KAF1299490.1 hypothetical protein BAU15_02280 [Enterococcus sp. JM4C]